MLGKGEGGGATGGGNGRWRECTGTLETGHIVKRKSVTTVVEWKKRVNGSEVRWD